MPAVTGMPIAEQQAPANPLAGYTGGGLNVSNAGVGFNPQSFVGSDAYNFIRDQGMEAIQRRAGANGTLLTGGTLKDLAKFGQGNASTFWGNQLDHDYRMAALNADISSGNSNRTLSGLTSLMGNGLNAAQSMGGYYSGMGQAGAGGTYGGASAINQGITGVANSLGGYFAQQRNQQQPVGPSTPGWFGS